MQKYANWYIFRNIFFLQVVDPRRIDDLKEKMYRNIKCLIFTKTKNMRALLVIDMQRGSFTDATPRYDTAGVTGRINQLAAYFRASGNMVVFIQHDGTAQGDFLPRSEPWMLLPGLISAETDRYIAKTANDCFYRSALGALLEAGGIKEVVITGCATDFCVDTTVKSALHADFTVKVAADAHTTADREGISAAQVIGYYNWIWSKMLPVFSGGLQVMTTKDIIAEILVISG